LSDVDVTFADRDLGKPLYVRYMRAGDVMKCTQCGHEVKRL
jgi:hypothetical protein